MNKPPLKYCNLLLDKGFSLLTVGEKKTPNYTWEKQQTQAFSKYQFEKRYNYAGGYKYTDDKGVEHEIAPTQGIGIITGYDNLEGVDVDLKVFSTLKAKQDFWEEYYSFLKDNIADFDQKFVIAKTKNDGYHIIYKCEEIQGNHVLASRPATKEELEINPKAKSRAIIETRGKYGYLFIYDKFVTDLRYQDVQYITPDERQILHECSRFYNVLEKEPEKIPKKEVKEYQGTDITPWEDYNNKTDIFDIISDEFTIPPRGHKTKFTQILRHGSEAAHSGYIYNDSGCMYLFSTGTRYPHEKLISPFKAYAIKHHNGDFSSAASELYRQGYGSRKQKKIVVKEELPEVKNTDFPIDVFPKFLQEYIIECNRTLNSSVDYMGCSMLWLFSVMIGNSFQVRIKNGWDEKCVIWLSIVGKAGLGKTPSIKNIIFPLEKINAKEIKKYIKEYAKFEEFQSLSAEEKKNSEQVKKPRKTQFIANDITMEALIGLHEENKNAVGVFKDELAGWIKDMNKYRAGSDVETWLSAWSSQQINMNRKTAKSSFLPNPFISVLGGIQPSILTQFFTQENKDNGFIDRLLLCYPDLEIEDFNDNEMSETLIHDYKELIMRFYEVVNKDLQYDEDMEIVSKTAYFDNEAKQEFKRIFSEITELQNSDVENEYMKSMLPKQKSYLARFSLLIHMINWFFGEYDENVHTNTIIKDSVLKAEKVMHYFINMAKKIKVDSVSINMLRKVYRQNDMKPAFEIFREMYAADPMLNKTDAADVLGVTRQSIHRYIKQIENDTK